MGQCWNSDCKQTYYQCVMAVGYSMSIFTLEKIVEPVYFARQIFNVDSYTKEDCRANVLCLSDIWCRLFHYRKSSTQCIKFVQYSMSIISLENIVKRSSQRIMHVRYSMSVITLEEIVEPMYYVCPIFDVNDCSSKNLRADVVCLSDILMSIITRQKIIDLIYNVRPIFLVDYYTREHSQANVSSTSDIRCWLLQ